ncbi:MAG: NADH-quinone oxidoreductase subunit NuoF [Nevskiales bacterium]
MSNQSVAELRETLPLTAAIAGKPHGAPAVQLQDYEHGDGYLAVKKTLKKLAPQQVTEVIKDAHLRGRGGAGFPTGVKWDLIPMGPDSGPKYLVCNADEMEPGTFKDRWLMEGDPHQLIEGMILAAYAIGAETAYIFLRGEYRLAAERLGHAINEAYAAGYLGDNILKSGFNLRIYLHSSAGRYICGEETALINSLEGRRATPRAKPPFPQISGLWGQPTIVNNVETLCNVPHILRNGAAWFTELGLGEANGSKLFGVSGRVNKPGCWELPMGTPIRHILEDKAGGMFDGFGFRGLLPGGASTDFLVEQHLDTPMDYENIAKAGSRMGTGTMIILDDATCPVGMVLNLSRFFARESCGWCTPCRDGLPWTTKLLAALEAGHGQTDDLALLAEQTRLLGPGKTFCALAPGAMEPLQSALKYFREDFEQHIAQACCPYHEQQHRRWGQCA